MSETMQVKCPNCQTDMRLHSPLLSRADNQYMSMICLMPSWSTLERKCPTCGMIVTPVIAPQIQVGWVAMEAPKEESRILPPSADMVAKAAMLRQNRG